jgi:hypothetical protein
MTRPTRLFLHIGLPKTGTTAWQHWAHTHREALRAQGLDYPEVDSITDSPNHSAIQPGIMKRDASRLRRFLDEGRCDAMLLSAEGLSFGLALYPAEGLKRFRVACASIEVICIVTVRPQEEWLRSVYRQSVLNRTNPRLGNGTAESIETFAARPHIRFLLDHEGLAREATRAYGAARCELIPYGEGAFVRFCETLGISSEGLPEPERLNVSAPLAVERLMVGVNAIGVGDDIRSGIKWLINQALPSRQTQLIAASQPEVSLLPAIHAVLGDLRLSDPDTSELVAKVREAAQRGFP